MGEKLDSLKESLQLKYFGIKDKRLRSFPIPQWRWLPFPGLICYRILLLIYVIAWLPVSINDEHNRRGWRIYFIFLTNWSYMMSLIHCILLSIISMHCYFSTPSNNSMNNTEIGLKPLWSVLYSLYWFSAILAYTMEAIVTIGYWGFQVDVDTFKTFPTGFLAINEHGIVLILLIVDFALCRIRIRWQHLHIPFLSCTVYVIFHAIYLEVTDRYAYKIMNHKDDVGKAIFFYLLLPVIAAPVVQFLWFGIFRLKLYVVRKHCQDGNISIPATDKEMINIV